MSKFNTHFRDGFNIGFNEKLVFLKQITHPHLVKSVEYSRIHNSDSHFYF